jgi:hypothetical protein
MEQALARALRFLCCRPGLFGEIRKGDQMPGRVLALCRTLACLYGSSIASSHYAGFDTQIDKAAQRCGVSKGVWVRRALMESRRAVAAAARPIWWNAWRRWLVPAGAIDEILAEIDEGRR